ncbi:MAG: YaaA family protein [Fusobacterium perfoetens]|uniref:YaaA family protein n=1 Tax=Fusobacterium perfoetens TaxID=852 RepID=UPI0023F24EFB|nr:YaaA family protein [Fusobacterium perfoetens]MCI6152172.1 YaaA family protein [Fusobacterium perfoetens]MDY3237937.1 YaaA family protein [Fusobacterium perfoetens]
MKIIFSPSKTMLDKKLNFLETKNPLLKNKTDIIIKKLKQLSIEDIEKIFKIKGKILEETFKNIQEFELLKEYPAISLYDGVAFRQLELNRYSKSQLEYLLNNLFVLSAFYGILSPNTKIKKYRLDMTNNILENNLYKFWSFDINNYLEKYSNEIFINLASKEFSKILDYKKFNVIDIEFRQSINGEEKNISTEAKKARGLLLNYIINNKIENIETLKNFNENGYIFLKDKSDEKKLFFLKNKI